MPNLTKLLETYDLRVPALGTGAAYKEGLSMAHPDIRRREGAMKRLKAHVDLAAVSKRRDVRLIGQMSDARMMKQ